MLFTLLQHMWALGGILMRTYKKISVGKLVVVILCALLLLVVSQNLAFNIGLLLTKAGLSAMIGNIMIAMLYVGFTYLGIQLLYKKFLHLDASFLRMPDMRKKNIFRAVWVVTAVFMPILAVFGFLFLGGDWYRVDIEPEQMKALITGTIFFYGFAAGAVEEMIFRGVIMGMLEQRIGRVKAVLLPSILFAVVHMVGSSFDVMSMLQLLVSGSLVGILFSLIAMESGSIWNSALVHGIWNMVMAGGILHIGKAIDSQALYNWVLNTDETLWTGGEFGAEASLIAITVYLLVICLALWRMQNPEKVARKRK
jgi:membrane protease YdiL (CAAX protease family)